VGENRSHGREFHMIGNMTAVLVHVGKLTIRKRGEFAGIIVVEKDGFF
jgi:hypothetical protein